MKERVVAFIDIGTNSVRILVVRLNPGSFTVLARQKEVVRLGEGEFTRGGHLKHEAIDRTVLVCHHFVELARSLKAEQIIAIATSATRDAVNRTALLKRLKEEAGIEVSVISGKEEARLTYLGVSSGIHLGEKQAVFIDIGGGSTEIVVGTQTEFSFIESTQLGALRISSLFPPADKDGRIHKKTYAAMRAYIDETLIGTVQALRSFRLDCAVGSSGTIENCTEIAFRLFHPKESQERKKILGRNDLRKLIALMCPMTTEERRKIPGMNPDRADIIVGGAAILESLMDMLGLDEIHASERGLRDGLLIDFLKREEDSFPIHDMSVRRMSVLRLARLFRVDETHAKTTAHLALALFDSGKKTGLHHLDDRRREILEYAALLHDVGSYLSFNNHELHSWYIIRNGDLLGFSEQEIAMMAYIARYHRKYLSPNQARTIRDLDAAITHDVRVLAHLLCRANSLDKSHSGVIQDARIVRLTQRIAYLELHAANGCQLELWGLDLHTNDFKRTFHRALDVKVHYSSSDSL
jgi:exopolyphosphatase/guanosine-5'-triphosphate,3'-diphosphate pyrophosphatase